MRRWRVVVIDDNPEGSLESVLLSPLVIGQPLPSDATSDLRKFAVETNLLNQFLPLPPGELYACEADIDFQVRDFATRRAQCNPRLPMIEIERDFARAWRLVTEFAENPPDIVFLDVMFDLKATPLSDIETIIDELQTFERIDISRPRPSSLEVLSRGGLFLLGKLLRSRGQVHRMPLIVLYSASRDVHTDFRPFEYASDGRFEVVDKLTLKTNPERRQEVFRRRIRDYFLDGTVRPDEVRTAVAMLGSPEAIGTDRETIFRALSRDLGSGWCFGALFAAESVAYLSREPAKRMAVVEELERFVTPLVTDARSFVDLMETSPARLFSHRSSVKVTYSRRPFWVEDEYGEDVNGSGLIRLSLDDLKRQIDDVRAALDDAVARLPISLRETLTADLETHGVIRKTTAADTDLPDARRKRLAKLGPFIRGLRDYSPKWQELLDRCRMVMPAAWIGEMLAGLKSTDINIEGLTSEILKGSWDRQHMFELVLAPSQAKVKEPLAALLTAIIDSARRHAYGGGAGTVHVSFSAKTAPATMEIEIRDHGAGFTDLRYYDPHGRGGDLSTALLAAANWFEVEIHSGGLMARPAMLGAGKVEESPVTRGTRFVMRIPAFRIKEED